MPAPKLVSIRAACLFLLVSGCTSDARNHSPIQQLDRYGPASMFPNEHWMQDGWIEPQISGWHWGETPIDPERVRWRTGFSVTQTSVLCWPEVANLDVERLPREQTPEDQGSVLVIDLTSGRYLRRLAEKDMHPDAEAPCLLVRPLEAVPDGHELAVVVRNDLMARPSALRELVEEPWRAPHLAPAYLDLLERLRSLGLASDEVAVAWRFPVDAAQTPLRSARAQRAVDPVWEWDEVRVTGEGEALPDRTFLSARGRFLSRSFLASDGGLVFDAGGEVLPQGETWADLYVHVSTAAAEAEAGTAPVLLFGHGIFGDPELYLSDPSDPSGLIALAEEGGYVVVGTSWLGLASVDRASLPAIAMDPARIHEIPDRMVQAHTNVAVLLDAIDAGLLADPVLSGKFGQAVVDPTVVHYYGISLGGIEGAVLHAVEDRLDAVALHVGGAYWSTMLERSSHWSLFEPFVMSAVEDPSARQHLYAYSQLYWDPVDPVGYSQTMRGRPVLAQVAMGDDQVPNMSSHVLARSAGWGLLTPEADPVPGLSSFGGGYSEGGVMVQFDPHMGRPDNVNRPSPVTGAHVAPRHWAGTRRQLLYFLRPGAEGAVEHFCGDVVCSSTVRGEEE